MTNTVEYNLIDPYAYFLRNKTIKYYSYLVDSLTSNYSNS